MKDVRNPRSKHVATMLMEQLCSRFWSSRAVHIWKTSYWCIRYISSDDLVRHVHHTPSFQTRRCTFQFRTVAYLHLPYFLISSWILRQVRRECSWHVLKATISPSGMMLTVIAKWWYPDVHFCGQVKAHLFHLFVTYRGEALQIKILSPGYVSNYRFLKREIPSERLLDS